MMNLSNYKILFHFLKNIESKEENILNQELHIFDIFLQLLLKSESNESNYLIIKIYDTKLISQSSIKIKHNICFLHLKNENESELFNIKESFNETTLEEIRNDNWKLHKKWIEEGNPSEILQIIRNDDIEKLQEISSQNGFDFNQKIAQSPYERYTFITKENVSLIDYAAFYGSINCFKFLLSNGSNIKNTGKFAIAGGNLEIIHLCEQNKTSFLDSCEAAIEFHRNDVFRYLYVNNYKESKNDTNFGSFKLINFSFPYKSSTQNYQKDERKRINFGIKCIEANNYEILSFLEEDGLNINDIMLQIAMKSGNINLVKFLLKGKEFPTYSLPFATSSGNIEFVKLLLQQKRIDINVKGVNKEYLILILTI